MVAEKAKAPLSWSGFPRKNNCSVRSRILYLKEGDANTSFFHQQARFRKKKNFIPKLKFGEEIAVSQEDKQAIVFNFYENLIGKAEDRDYTIDLGEIGIQ